MYSIPNANKNLLDRVMQFPYLKIQYDNSKITSKHRDFFTFMDEISEDLTRY